MAKTKVYPNAVKPRQFRLSEDTLADLDLVAERHRLETRTAAIRFLAGKEADSLRGGPPKKISRKSHKGT